MIVYGFRSRNKVLGQVAYVCPQCHKNSYHTIVRSRRWFTLFFIPLFPFTKTSTSRCNICGVQTRIHNQQAEAYFEQPQQPQVISQPAAAPAPASQPAPQYPATPNYYNTDQSARF
ncbi:zinc-ribbon domain-containing protein [Dictyobacter arantiisoli]|uniref:Zinc-ribbon 15 domain-containing protein n=1 Tax=Dictyobacter arantiisoli TaxID=2014874 RepID=A0A5A5TBV7_9CHLR|nr:zinc-ribbon domain-containing protein [Dictyobacter arantiisoli]GCF08414.1 hypothetical protein KDI_19780 [Dictyobacter arantiisoli]